MKYKLVSRRNFIIGGLATIAYLVFEVTSIAVTRYKVTIKNLPPQFQGFNILQLSDLHSKWYGNNQESLLELIHNEKFDIVAITGDIVDKRNPILEASIELIKGLKDYPIYFVPGNHEHWSSSSYKIIKTLHELGVKILANKAEKFNKGNEHIWLVGVDDPYKGLDRLDIALQEVSDSNSKVLLAHAPNIFPKAIKENIDLALVGHTHGGQIRIPFFGALVAPGQGWFPKYDYGLYSEGNSTMIVNGGLGESIIPIRFNVRPEIVVITLERDRFASI